MADKYRSFEELKASEREGGDFRIVCEPRNSHVAVFAPHGGYIEPTTSLIASATARDDLSLYLFESLKPGRPHSDLHVTSHLFDEPQALALAQETQSIMAIHGRLDRDDPSAVWIRGRDGDFARSVHRLLSAQGFAGRMEGHDMRGEHPQNICNRGRTKKGVQLEIPMTLRDRLRDDAKSLSAFTDAVRSAIFTYGSD